MIAITYWILNYFVFIDHYFSSKKNTKMMKLSMSWITILFLALAAVQYINCNELSLHVLSDVMDQTETISKFNAILYIQYKIECLYISSRISGFI